MACRIMKVQGREIGVYLCAGQDVVERETCSQLPPLGGNLSSMGIVGGIVCHQKKSHFNLDKIIFMKLTQSEVVSTYCLNIEVKGETFGIISIPIL